MRGSGWTAKYRAMASRSGRMARSSVANGSRTKCMVLVSISMLMESDMRASLWAT